MPHSSPISLDHIRTWSSRSKLIESDLKEASNETRNRWVDLMRLLVTQRAEKHGVREATKELAPDLILSERAKNQVIRELSECFAADRKTFSQKVHRATGKVAGERDETRRSVQEMALQRSIIEALSDADREQITRIGDDRAWGHGSRLVRLQKQDLKEVAKNGLTDELVQKLSARPTGLRVFPSEGVLRPIEAVYLREDLEPDRVRPLDLRPCLLLHWVRTRAFKLAEERLLEEAGLDRTDAPNSYREVEVRDSRSELDEKPSPREEVSELELLEAVDREYSDPLSGLIAAEEWQQVVQSATPSQREILAFLRRLLRTGEDLTEAKKTVVEVLDFASPNRVDVAFSNLRSEADDPR